MANEERLDVAALKQENRELRQALHAVVDAIEASPAQIDVDATRRVLPDVIPDGDQIVPPWTREGYGSKDEWLDDRRKGGDSR